MCLSCVLRDMARRLGRPPSKHESFLLEVAASGASRITTLVEPTHGGPLSRWIRSLSTGDSFVAGMLIAAAIMLATMMMVNHEQRVELTDSYERVVKEWRITAEGAFNQGYLASQRDMDKAAGQ
jgi:hypothetical protein